MILDGVTLVALLVVLPAFAIVQARALRGMRILRVPAYVSSAATLVGLGGWCALIGSRYQGPSSLGLVAITPVAGVGWTLAVTLAALGLMLGFRVLGGALHLQESPTLRELMPRTREERIVFAGLALVAGLSEELVFRGYAFSVLGGAVGLVTTGIVTSLAFGVLHAYQGVLGMVRTAALGGVLAWAFVTSGSIWPVAAAHTIIDLLGGLVFTEDLMSPEDGNGVS